jgi:hypothetical protein
MVRIRTRGAAAATEGASRFIYTRGDRRWAELHARDLPLVAVADKDVM